jgi:hypothetical protein
MTRNVKTFLFGFVVDCTVCIVTERGVPGRYALGFTQSLLKNVVILNEDAGKFKLHELLDKMHFLRKDHEKVHGFYLKGNLVSCVLKIWK